MEYELVVKVALPKNSMYVLVVSIKKMSWQCKPMNGSVPA